MYLIVYLIGGILLAHLTLVNNTSTSSDWIKESQKSQDKELSLQHAATQWNPIAESHSGKVRLW